MKKNFLKILAILILIILQLTFLPKLMIFSSIPNLIIIVSLSLLFRGFLSDSLMVAILGGLFLDLASPLRFGIYTLFLIAIILLLNLVILKNIPEPNLLIIYFLFFLIFGILNLLIFLFIHLAPNLLIILDAALSSLWGIVIYLLIGRLMGPKEELKLT